MKDWIDNLDRKIFPFVEYPGCEARYPAIEGLQILPSEAAELRMMSRKLYKVFQKTCDVARKGGEKFLSDMEIPRKLWPYLSIQNPLGVPTWISRFDFVKDRNLGFRMVELNADTPCAVIEAYYGNGMYCGKQAWLDPNAGEREKLKMFLRKVFHAGFHPTADLSNGRIVAAKPFVFSCFPDYVEDYGTSMYLMNTMKEAVRDESPVVPVDDSIRFASFYDLRVDKDTGDCVIPGGTIAGGLYRLHPLEILVDEESEDGYPIGTRLLDGYADGRFVMMNPPESILMQSKAFQALVWSLYLDGRFYNSDEQRLIKGCLFPTFFTEDDCAEGMTYIEKPIWGREGLGIRVRRDGKTVFKKEVPNEDDVVRRDSKSTVFQQFADQPTERILTDEGPKMVELGARLGGDCITTHLVPLSTGVDMVGATIRLACGEDVSIAPKWDKGAAIAYFDACNGVIRSIEGVEEARQMPGVKELSIVHQAGERIGEIRNSVDRIGFVIAQGETAEEAIQICRKAMQAVRIEISRDA